MFPPGRGTDDLRRSSVSDGQQRLRGIQHTSMGQQSRQVTGVAQAAEQLSQGHSTAHAASASTSQATANLGNLRPLTLTTVLTAQTQQPIRSGQENQAQAIQESDHQRVRFNQHARLTEIQGVNPPGNMSDLLSLSTNVSLDSGMELFHAASREDVISILRTGISPEQGGGLLGQGFYTGTSPFTALSWSAVAIAEAGAVLTEIEPVVAEAEAMVPLAEVEGEVTVSDIPPDEFEQIVVDGSIIEGGDNTLVIKITMSDGNRLNGIEYPCTELEQANPGRSYQLNNNQFTLEQFRSENLDYIIHHDNQINGTEVKFHFTDRLVPIDVMAINESGEFESILDQDEEIMNLLRRYGAPSSNSSQVREPSTNTATQMRNQADQRPDQAEGQDGCCTIL